MSQSSRNLGVGVCLLLVCFVSLLHVSLDQQGTQEDEELTKYGAAPGAARNWFAHGLGRECKSESSSENTPAYESYSENGLLTPGAFLSRCCGGSKLKLCGLKELSCFFIGSGPIVPCKLHQNCPRT